MKVARVAFLCLAASGAVALEGPIGDVVEKLKAMLENSKAEAETEATSFAEFKAYCTEWTSKSEQSISTMSTRMETLSNSIEGLTAKKAKLEEEIEDLNGDLAENNETQSMATATRTQEAQAFTALDTDLSQRIVQLDDAYGKVSTFNGEDDAAKETDATALLLDEVSAAAGANLRQMQESLRRPKSFLQVQQQQKYAPQSGGVLGVLKSVLDNTKKDLTEANDEEDKAINAHSKLIANLIQEQDTMTASKSSKNSEVGSTASEIGTKTEELAAATKTKTDDEAFLADLQSRCATKTRINNERLELRRKENLAIQTAITTLDSDRGARVFKKAKSTGDSEAKFFLQLAADVHPHVASSPSEIAALLRAAAHKSHSTRLAEVAGRVEVAVATAKGDFNPFAIVLKEIDTMKGRIDDEGGMDKKQLDWCSKERASSTATKEEKERQILDLQGQISNLDTAINDPESGLVVTTQAMEDDLKTNAEEQANMTVSRKAENKEYQKNIQNLVLAQGMLNKAVDALKDYYAEMQGHRLNNLLQKKKKVRKSHEEPSGTASEAPDAPETADSAFAGQSDEGAAVIAMLDNIIQDTEEEEAEAHKAEGEGQEAFEDSMKLLTDTESDLMKDIAENKQELASTEVELTTRKEELEATEKENQTVVEYLRQIKPSCDFITVNFDAREASRSTEKEGLDNAKQLIKDSPAYKSLSDIAKRKR